ncbi:MAG: hypothetical protein OXC37_00485, partial [Bdellovibrionaceae bacterium]|nr:hypothetical protein [Pseudobdellovibrionaceae bacterium]
MHKVILAYRSKKGSFLLEMLIAISLFSLMTVVTSNYFFKFLNEKKKIETYIKNENVDQLIEYFFQDEDNCTETLKGIQDKDSLDKLKMSNISNLDFYTDLINENKIKGSANGKPRVLVKNLGKDYAMAIIEYQSEIL